MYFRDAATGATAIMEAYFCDAPPKRILRVQTSPQVVRIAGFFFFFFLYRRFQTALDHDNVAINIDEFRDATRARVV